MLERALCLKMQKQKTLGISYSEDGHKSDTIERRTTLREQTAATETEGGYVGYVSATSSTSDRNERLEEHCKSNGGVLYELGFVS